jgi:acyl carrier protein
VASPSRQGTPQGCSEGVTQPTSDTRATVLAAIARVRAERGAPAVPLSDDAVLGEGGLGLDSLDVATVVAELDALLNKDPFAEGVQRFRTVAEFVKLYVSDPQR